MVIGFRVVIVVVMALALAVTWYFFMFCLLVSVFLALSFISVLLFNVLLPNAASFIFFCLIRFAAATYSKPNQARQEFQSELQLHVTSCSWSAVDVLSTAPKNLYL